MCFKDWEYILFLYQSTREIKIAAGVIKQPIEKNQKEGEKIFNQLNLIKNQISLTRYLYLA